MDVAIDTERLERKLRVMVKHYGALADELKHIDEDCLREELQNPELVHTCLMSEDGERIQAISDQQLTYPELQRDWVP